MPSSTGSSAFADDDCCVGGKISAPNPPYESSFQRMSRHQIVRMLPARQRLDAVEPLADRGVRGGNVEAELLGRIVEIADHRDVGDGRSLAQHEGARRQ